MKSNAALRKKIRQARRSLSVNEQKQHAAEAFRLARSSPLFLQSKRIAAYIAADGELNPSPLLDYAASCKKEIYLPVLRPFSNNSLWFSRYLSGDRLLPNRFSIDEPNISRYPPVPLWTLDLILLPLVAFDNKGHRLGMGGGYYDRTLARLKQHARLPQPKLFGYAHECQKSSRIKINQWDIPLDGIITEKRIYYCR